MMKILSTKQIRELDAYTIQHEPVASIDLMERACRAFTNWLVQYFDTSKKIGIICGTGNNGGDGLGVARMLSDWGYGVKVWIVRGLVPESDDFKINFNRIQGKMQLEEIVTHADPSLFADRDVLIDAIFGSGLSRPAEGIYAQTINSVNKAASIRIAIDVPSGLASDKTSSGEIVRAHYTVSFQLPKLAFFFPQAYQFTGEWVVVDIGLNKKFIKQSEAAFYYTRSKDAAKILHTRSRFDHKGVFGHALLIAGSQGKMGAAVLSARAALRSGVGLLTVHVPGCGYEIIQTSVPEAMANTDLNEHFFSTLPALENFSTIGIGPGLGQEKITVKAFSELLEKFRKPMVIDADGLNIVSANKEMFKLIPPGSILTPHVKEFERLSGKAKDDFERLEKQKQLAAELKSVIILKGAYTAIADANGNVYFNATGNPGMATGGTGDVLTGVLTGLLAQNYYPHEAAILGAFLHGLSGDIAMSDRGVDALIASDLVDHLSSAFLKITDK